jgi:hypothetical protein
MAVGYSTFALAQPHDHDHDPKPGEHDHDPKPGEHDHDKDKDHSDDFTKRLHDMAEARRAARMQAIRDAKAWEASRERRAEESRRAMEGIWGQEFLRRPECQPELGLYGERMARLNRIIDIGTPAQVARARAIIEREHRRHARAMEALRMRLGVGLEVH